MLHTSVLSTNAVKSSVLLGSYASTAAPSPIVFRGIGHRIAADSILSIPVLRGNAASTYSANPLKSIEGAPTAGDDVLLVTATQARNNARVTVSGSVDMFTNSFFAAKVDGGAQVGNALFCAELSKWSFGEAGVLRFRDIEHSKVDGTPPDVILHEKKRPDLPATLYPDPELTRNSLVYRIKDDISYSMIVEEKVNGHWKPFSADDMQMELVMLDPYVRKTMTSDPKTGKFTAVFTAPDSYGIYKFRVLYRRAGYSVLHAETKVSIRPFKHNEYERFIPSAYPYYSSAISAMLAFLVFSLFFLF